MRVGGAEQRLGLAERELVSNAGQGFVQPMRKFLDTEMKTIAREKRLLETKRFVFFMYLTLVILILFSIFLSMLYFQ